MNRILCMAMVAVLLWPREILGTGAASSLMVSVGPQTLHGAIAQSIQNMAAAGMLKSGSLLHGLAIELNFRDYDNIDNSLSLLQRLATGLNFQDYDNIDNSLRLRPIMKAFQDQHHPVEKLDAAAFRALATELADQAKEILFAAQEAEDLVNSRVNSIRKAWEERRLRSLDGQAMPTAYQNLRRIYALEQAYLTGQNQEWLTNNWPRFKKDHDSVMAEQRAERDRRITRNMEQNQQGLAGEYRPDQDTLGYDPLYLGSQSQDDGPQQGSPEDQSVYLADMPVMPVDEHMPGYWPPTQEELERREEEQRQQREAQNLLDTFFAQGDPEEAASKRYPISVIELKYFEKLRAAATPGDIVKFWMWVDIAFNEMRERMEDLFRDFRRVGRLGPRARAVMDTLEGQSRELYERIEGLRPKEVVGYAAIDKHLRLYEDLRALIARTKKEFEDKEAAAQRKARVASEIIRQNMNAQDRAIVRHLLDLVDYYKLRVRQAARDMVDPLHHREEISKELNGYGPLDIFSLRDAFQIWSYVFSERPGDIRALWIGALLSVLGASLLNLSWLVPVVLFSSFHMPIVSYTLFASMLTVLSLNTNRKITRAALLLPVLAFTGIAYTQAPLVTVFIMLATSAIATMTYLWASRSVNRFSRFRHLGAEINALFFR